MTIGQLLPRPPPGHIPKDFEKGFKCNPQVYVPGQGCLEIRPGQTVVVGTTRFTRMANGAISSGPYKGKDCENAKAPETKKIVSMAEFLGVPIGEMLMAKIRKDQGLDVEEVKEEDKLVIEELEESDEQKVLEDLKGTDSKEVNELLDQEDQNAEDEQVEDSEIEELEESDDQKVLEDLKGTDSKEIDELLDQEDQKAEDEQVEDSEIEELEGSDEDSDKDSEKDSDKDSDEILEDMKAQDSDDCDDGPAPEADMVFDEDFIDWMTEIIGNPMFIIFSSLLVGVLAFFMYDFMYGLNE